MAVAPFDHDRRCVSVLVDRGTERLLITKGAPESVLDRCTGVPDEARRVLEREFAAGKRVAAVATRTAPELTTVTPADEHDLHLVGFLAFLDQPKPSAAGSIARLAALGITVKIVTGDNPVVAETVCRSLSVPSDGTLTGADLDALDDAQLTDAVTQTSIFARVSPEQKARILSAQRRAGSAVAFLGDGVNDALALHHADVGISVDSATDVAKDAADIILLERDLDVLADGVVEGRRIFANTIKYVLMGTSSNFGNMFSVTVAAAFLPFLPMLPFQILLNNLLYDTSQLTIPTDRVDEEQLVRPSHWDIGFVRRFMVRFGPISSVFDFATFAVMLWVFHAAAPLFRSGWFVESLATQTLIVFAIRTRRVPFFRSSPSTPLLVSVIAVVVIGALIPESPLHGALGFAPLPLAFFAVLVAFVVGYLVCVEVAKYFFFKVHAITDQASAATRPRAPRPPRRRPVEPPRASAGPSVNERRAGRSGLHESLNEGERGVGHFAPPVVDRERVSAVRQPVPHGVPLRSVAQSYAAHSEAPYGRRQVQANTGI